MKQKGPEFDAERVRDISEKVYRARVGAEGCARMEKEAKIPGAVRRNAGAYDTLTREYLRALEVAL